MMRAGLLRHRVTLQSQGTTQDTSGEVLPAWVDVATVWARISPITGREFFAAQATQHEATNKINMRYRAGVIEKMRATWNNKVYNIKHVLDFDERHADLILLCGEGLNDG